MAYPLQVNERIVISTRIRLARNFAAYPFPKKMDEAQAEDIVVLVREGLRDLDEFTEYNLKEITPEKAKMLQERYVISSALLKSKGGAAFVSADEAMSIMVNEEDHLRQQYICGGLKLEDAYERILGIDESLSSDYDFAFHEKLGFLTACPSNLGTGMRASVMMFLPGLAKSGELKELLPAIKAAGMTVRGAFGEGTVAEGYLYQISNERTLGWSETRILETVKHAVLDLCEKEREARAQMLKADGEDLKDSCLRAYGVLTHCAILSEDEFLSKMTDVRLGVALGFLEALDAQGFEDFLNDMRTAAFRFDNKLKGKRERFCDALRAETVGNTLPRFVRVKRS